MVGLLLALVGCRPVVIGMRIGAEVTCAPTEPDGTCPWLDIDVVPCRCNAHHFDEDAGFVEVWDERLDEGDPAVVFTLDYASEYSLCGADLLVREDTVPIGAAGSDESLYTVDASAALTPTPDAPLLEEDGDTLVFEYPTEGGIVTETHTVRFREAMDVHPVWGIPCCGTPAAPSLAGMLAAAALLARRRPGRSRRGRRKPRSAAP